MNTDSSTDRAEGLMRFLLTSVRTLSVFENTDKQLMAALQRSPHQVRYVNKINNGGPAPEKSTRMTADAFNSKSTDFECLSLSFVVNAQGFFNATASPTDLAPATLGRRMTESLGSQAIGETLRLPRPLKPSRSTARY
jgi:hypothetical protein